MYYYIFDQFLNETKYQSLVNKIEARLTDLGINGRSEKLTILKSLPDTMNEIVKKRGLDDRRGRERSYGQ